MTNYQYPVMESLKGIGAAKFIESLLMRKQPCGARYEDIVINAIDEENGTIVATLVNEHGNPYRVVIYEDSYRIKDAIDGNLHTVSWKLTIHDIGDTTNVEA